MNFQIILLDPADYEKCYDIWGKPEANAQEWFKELVGGNRKIYVSVAGGEFIGEIALVYDKHDPDYTIPGQRAYLSRLIVKREFRGRGIGSALVDHLVLQAKSEGLSELSLGVDLDNPVAIHLYENKGFTTEIYRGEDEAGEYVKLLKKL